MNSLKKKIMYDTLTALIKYLDSKNIDYSFEILNNKDLSYFKIRIKTDIAIHSHLAPYTQEELSDALQNIEHFLNEKE